MPNASKTGCMKKEKRVSNFGLSREGNCGDSEPHSNPLEQPSYCSSPRQMAQGPNFKARPQGRKAAVLESRETQVVIKVGT